MTRAPAQSTFYEFFAGGGMARAGLGADWRCLFANDFDARKRDAYRANWGEGAFVHADIHTLRAHDLPGRADLAWASFPCQDLSLAGLGKGLSGARSGAFWGFHALMAALAHEGRAPRTLVLENVVGALTANGGRDFAQLCAALADLDYVFGALIIDAARFTPQSRPRLFIVAAHASLDTPEGVTQAQAQEAWTSATLARAYAALPQAIKARWRWWSMPAPAASNTRLIDIIEREPRDVRWHDAAQTAHLLALMAPLHREKLAQVVASGAHAVGALYRRTRRDENGARVQRAEVRFDGLAGCLRTPGGGSSRQSLVIVEDGRVRTRLLSGREAARLMGLPDEFKLPSRYTDAYHLLGDGLAAPVIAHLAKHLLRPLVAPRARRNAAA